MYPGGERFETFLRGSSIFWISVRTCFRKFGQKDLSSNVGVLSIYDAPQENQAYWHRMCTADNNRQDVRTRLVRFDYVWHDFKRVANNF